MSEDEELKKLLDDDDIRGYFQGRDPTRKKVDPRIAFEHEEEDKGKASALTPKEETEEVHGVSFSQHVKRIREAARHYLWIGLSLGLAIAIVVTFLK